MRHHISFKLIRSATTPAVSRSMARAARSNPWSPSPPEPGASPARPRTSWRRPVTSGWRRRTNAASSRIWSSPSGAWTRDQNLRPGSTPEKLAALKPVFGLDGPDPTMTAGNSTPLTDGAAVVLLASEEWAERRGLEPLAYLTAYETAAVDFVRR